MVLLGLGLLIASVSFLCYRHPPWSFLSWLQRPTLQDVPSSKREQDAPPTIPPHDGSSSSKKASIPIKRDGVVHTAVPTISLGELGREEVPPSSKAEQDAKAMPPPSKANLDRKAMPPPSRIDIDRKAMPPPPPPFKNPQPSLKTPIEGPKTPAPTFTLAPNSEDHEPAPSFPALNSAQRASSGPRAPSFPAVNSAQRASGGTQAPQRLPPVSRTSQSSLMAPPRGPLPNRGPSSLAPPPSHSAVPTKPRKKVQLTPGHSPLDWARLSSSPIANLRGLPPDTPYLRVPPSLLKTMTGRKGKDAWMVLGGKVYNMTPYLPYHPGGEAEILKGAGRDGTRLFGEVHPWVNWEGMLEGCLVGVAVEESEIVSKGTLDEMD